MLIFSLGCFNPAAVGNWSCSYKEHATIPEQPRTEVYAEMLQPLGLGGCISRYAFVLCSNYVPLASGVYTYNRPPLFPY